MVTIPTWSFRMIGGILPSRILEDSSGAGPGRQLRDEGGRFWSQQHYGGPLGLG